MHDPRDGNVGLSVGPPLWSRMRYQNNYWMDCNEILARSTAEFFNEEDNTVLHAQWKHVPTLFLSILFL